MRWSSKKRLCQFGNSLSLLIEKLTDWLSMTRFSFKLPAHQQAICVKQTQQNKAKFAFNMTLTSWGELLRHPKWSVVALMRFVSRLSFSLSPSLLPFSFLCASARQRAAIRLSLSELVFTIPEFNERLQRISRWFADEQELICFDHSLSGGLQRWKSR